MTLFIVGGCFCKPSKDHRHFRSRLHAIVLKHVWDQLFTVNTIWSIGETGDIYSEKLANLQDNCNCLIFHSCTPGRTIDL